MRDCPSDHLNTDWVLSDEELMLLQGKSGPGRLVLCILLKHCQLHGRFPDRLDRISETGSEFLASQISSSVEDLAAMGSGRMGRRHRQEVRTFLSIRRFDAAGRSAFRAWVRRSLLPEAADALAMDALIGDWFVKNRFERPSAGSLARLFGAAERAFERDLFQAVVDRLTPDHCARLDHLLETAKATSHFSLLKSDPGAVSLKNVLKATSYPHLEPIFAPSPINWGAITPYYDEMIKLATALLKRTSEPEAILRRFTRGQGQHPVYTALLELAA